VSVEVVDSGEAMEIAVAQHRSELIVSPMLKKIIPKSIWAKHRCLVVHPRPERRPRAIVARLGDRARHE
jgi:putative two-component system hydrogenase maturation factor HypX/HoxX